MLDPPSMTEPIPTVTTPNPFQYRAVPIYPSDWKAECTKQNAHGSTTSSARASWEFKPSSLSPPPTTASAVVLTPQYIPEQPIQFARNMATDQSSGRNSTVFPLRPPVYLTKSIFESPASFRIPEDAAAFPYDDAFLSPGFVGKSINEGTLDISNIMNCLYPGQVPVTDGAVYIHSDWNTTWLTSGHQLPHGSAFYRDVVRTQASETQAMSPFLAHLETPTVSPTLILLSDPYGNNAGSGMSDFSVGSTSSVRSDGNFGMLFDDSDTFNSPSDLCPTRTRTSSRESTRRLPTTGLSCEKARQSSRAPSELEAVSPDWKATHRSASGQLAASRKPQTNTEPAETSSEITRLSRKRKYDLISPVPLTAERIGLKRNSEDRLPHPKEAVSHIGAHPIAPPKRKPGRPLSTSSEARAIVRDLAESHIGPKNKGLLTELAFSAAAFDHTLPPFPEVSVYVGERNADISSSLPAIDEEEENQAVGHDNATEAEAGNRLTRSNRVTARKHRELIKERTKNLEDVKSWMDQALPVYERVNRKLLDTIERLRRGNEALLAQGDHPNAASK